MDIIKKAEEFAKKRYEKNDPEHRWCHIENVIKRALKIAEKFRHIDHEALKLAIIFHDIDHTHENRTEMSALTSEKFLTENDYPQSRIRKVKEIILNHSNTYRKKIGDAKLIEGKIIYDADKSLNITNFESFQKFSSMLYLEETKTLIKKEINKTMN